MAILANQGMNCLIGENLPTPMGNSHPNVVPYRAFPVADGDVIVAVGNDNQFRALCRVLGREDLADNRDYTRNDGRVINRARLEAELSMLLCEWRREELLAAFDANGVPGGPINRINQVYEDPHVQARAVLEHHVMPGGQTVPLTRFPALLSKTPATIRKLPPSIGAQTEETLRGLLALNPTEIARLLEQGIVSK